MDHKASYIMTRATVVAEVIHKGQVGISHINMSAMVCMAGGFQQGDSCRRIGGRVEVVLDTVALNLLTIVWSRQYAGGRDV